MPASSEYTKLLNSSSKAVRRTRTSPYTEEERTERRKRSARLAMESRRRAVTVLINTHRKEYEEVYDRERQALLDSGDPKYVAPKE